LGQQCGRSRKIDVAERAIAQGFPTSTEQRIVGSGERYAIQGDEGERAPRDVDALEETGRGEQTRRFVVGEHPDQLTALVFVLREDRDGQTFAHLGDLGHELTSAQIEDIGDIDVLFVPVGGNESLNASEAVAVIAQLEPRIVIPMHYAGPQAILDLPLDPIERFLNEMGVKEPVFEEKLTVSSGSLPPEGSAARVVLLRPAAVA